jgi:hypothetical protein
MLALSMRLKLRKFLQDHPGQVPTLHRLGKHYEPGNVEFATKSSNSAQTSLTLTFHDFREVWALITKWSATDSEIAKRYGRSPQTIGRIRNGDTYKEFRERAQRGIQRIMTYSGQTIPGLRFED